MSTSSYTLGTAPHCMSSGTQGTAPIVHPVALRTQPPIVHPVAPRVQAPETLPWASALPVPRPQVQAVIPEVGQAPIQPQSSDADTRCVASAVCEVRWRANQLCNRHRWL